VNQTELETLTIAELYNLAKQHGIPSYRKYKKAQLIEMLQAPAPEKKKRGRPAKEKTDTPASEAKAPQQRKRGRPAKADETQQTGPVQKESAPEAPVLALEQSPELPHAEASQPISATDLSTSEAEKQQEHTNVEQRQQYSRNNHRQQNGPQNRNRNFRQGNNRPQYHAPDGEQKPAEPIQLPETGTAAGVLEIMEGYGFLRVSNYDSGHNDVYVANAQIRRCNLKNGDFVEGRTRARREGDKYEALLYVDRVNGKDPDENAVNRVNYEDLVPIFPNERYTLETPGRVNNLSVRLIDLIAPIGKGQRAMIVSQPKAGKTTLLKQIANGITENYPDTHLIVLLIDERPEEVTDMRRSIKGEVVASTFDELPEHHTRIAEMVQERAMRLVEDGRDVVILLDSLTRLTRAYNLVIPPTGRTLSGGMDPGALHKPKRFFGAARNIENGGSLTVIATALVETGSRMDDIVYEEFKGTGNMEIHLDRRLSEKRIFPAIDVYKSGTRRDDLLLTKTELDGVRMLRRMLANGGTGDVTENLVNMMDKTSNNEDFLIRLKDWVRIFEKEGFTSSHAQQNRYGQ
jgi:transcription termination factor Rho